MSEDAIAEACPVCRQNCNCTVCLHKPSQVSLPLLDVSWIFPCSLLKRKFDKILWFFYVVFEEP